MSESLEVRLSTFLRCKTLNEMKKVLYVEKGLIL